MTIRHRMIRNEPAAPSPMSSPPSNVTFSATGSEMSRNGRKAPLDTDLENPTGAPGARPDSPAMPAPC